jgi:hypothetical protein
VFCSGRFQEIAIVDNITAMRKVGRASLGRRLHNYSTLALRALYIAARKSGIVHSKSTGRRLLKKWTRQSWLPAVILIFFCAITR